MIIRLAFSYMEENQNIRGGTGRTGHAGTSWGIGENAPTIRARICEGLGFLGIALEEKQNLINAGVISAKNSLVSVRVIHTDEEWTIANMVYRVLDFKIENKKDVRQESPYEGDK